MSPEEASAEIRRRTRCTPQEAKSLQSQLGSLEAVRRHPDLIADLVEDPRPSLLAKFRPQRSLILRSLRRGQKLQALRLLGPEIPTTLANRFLRSLSERGQHWQLLERLYGYPKEDFWASRPPISKVPETSFSLRLAPEKFDPYLLMDWVREGAYRDATLWVRRVSGAPREDCQAFVDRLEELLFEEEANPWEKLATQWSHVLAGLGDLPNPDWLHKLLSRRQELMDLMESRKQLAAVEMVVSQMGCSSLEARQFLRKAQVCGDWVEVIRNVYKGKIWKPKPLPPRPLAAAVAPIAAAAPAAAPPPAPPAAPVAVSPPVAAAEPAASLPEEPALQGPAPEGSYDPDGDHIQLGVTANPTMPWDKPVEVSSSPPPPPAPTFDLNDRAVLFEQLALLAAAVQANRMNEAEEIYAGLARSGFGRAWVVQQFPAALPWLPDEPWEKKLHEVSSLASALQAGTLKPQEVVQEQLEAALKKTALDEIVASLEKAWRTKDRRDMNEAVTLLKANPDLTQEINKRVPWLSDLLDLDHDGTADVIELAQDPGQYFEELLDNEFPDLRKRLGEARLSAIKGALPELFQALKERNMRNVMRVMSRLKLGPGDVKTLLSLLKTLMQRRKR